jgi:3-methylfumaryl-CoA hydratase
MSVWEAWVGREAIHHDVLTPALLTRFRATLDSAETGNVAPQGIHWCLCLPDAPTSRLGADGHPLLDDSNFLPPLPFPRRMWASSSIEFFAPINSGDTVMRRSTISGVIEKQGGSGALVFVTIDHETSAGDVVAVTERQTLVYRAASTATPEPVPDSEAPDLNGWQWHRAITPCEAMLFRFSALTFNSHRIHYDRPYAEDEERYRGLVVHGPLTASLLLDFVARNAGANRLKNFSFRGQSPAFAGETLHLVGRQAGDVVTLAACGNDGRDVMTAQATL